MLSALLGCVCVFHLLPMVGARVVTASSHIDSTAGVPQMVRPIRVHGGLLYRPGVGMYIESAGLMVSDPVAATIEEQADRWAQLHELVVLGGVVDARAEAANKLISNRFRVLHDVTNPVPKSQPELTRVTMNDAHHVDQCLREISRRLLSGRAGAPLLEEHLESSQPGQAKAWALTAQFLSKRLQAAANDCPGREPDMSAAAAEAFAAVLSDVGGMALHAWAAEEAPEAEAPAP